MASSLNLRNILSKAPSIHVFYNDRVTVLKCRMKGANHKDTLLSKHSIIGDGTKQLPFTTRAMDVSPYNVIVDLWLQNRSYTSRDTKPIFIEVNDWVLQVEPDGVISEDDYFTKLLPD